MARYERTHTRRTEWREMLFGEADPTAPWWLARALGVVAVVLAALRVYDWYRRQRVVWAEAQNKLDADARADLTEEQRETRRDAADEAWGLNDRLIQEFERIDAKFKESERRERDCAEERERERVEHAATKTVLRMLIAWANTQRHPPKIPAEILARLNEDGGSGPHRALPQEGTGT